MFDMNSKKDSAKQTNGVKVEDDDIIYISSDDEKKQQPTRGRDWCWTKHVTEAVGNWKKPQTLHVPSWIVKAALKNRTTIWLESVDTGRNYKSTVMTPTGRGENVRYIGDGWYSYLEDHKPRLGDLLDFRVTKPPNYILVMLTRRI
ncbi:hypothetical protein TSUD_186120 [Trifolium subterraneum]|uniref:TF-B3 domain-containing protein n=1 Tax=Trifolium subterraneum TaxID=3900 RepID=A0A2Z6PC45_TRISU|nr:hypothetical protein TSUD_186120 [Trifolium subterraneum]